MTHSGTFAVVHHETGDLMANRLTKLLMVAAEAIFGPPIVQETPPKSNTEGVALILKLKSPGESDRILIIEEMVDKPCRYARYPLEFDDSTPIFSRKSIEDIAGRISIKNSRRGAASPKKCAEFAIHCASDICGFLFDRGIVD